MWIDGNPYQFMLCEQAKRLVMGGGSKFAFQLNGDLSAGEGESKEERCGFAKMVQGLQGNARRFEILQFWLVCPRKRRKYNFL